MAAQASCRVSQTARLLGVAFSTTDKAWNVRMNATSRVPYCPPRAKQHGMKLKVGTPFPLGFTEEGIVRNGVLRSLLTDSLHSPPRDWLLSTSGTAQSHRPAESILRLQRAQEVEWWNEAMQQPRMNKGTKRLFLVSHSVFG